MALFGTLSVLSQQISSDKKFGVALAYAAEAVRPGTPAHRRIDSLAVGASERVELGDGIFAIEQVYLTKVRTDGFFESHRKYIDVQVIVEGAEFMEVEDIVRLAITQPYLEERDLIKYAPAVTDSRLLVRAGEAAVFFPSDGHMPGLQLGSDSTAPQPVLVRKTVVKVPVA